MSVFTKLIYIHKKLAYVKTFLRTNYAYIHTWSKCTYVCVLVVYVCIYTEDCGLWVDQRITKGCFRLRQSEGSSINLASSPSPIAYSRPHIADCLGRTGELGWPGALAQLTHSRVLHTLCVLLLNTQARYTQDFTAPALMHIYFTLQYFA